MCKILILQKHSPARRSALISAAWRYFSATGETDGFGAAWITRRGALGWAKSSAPTLADDLPSFCAGFAANAHLSEPSDGGWLLLHGRRATCGISVENTHPMLADGSVALIHNGVVRSDTVENISTTCDSELLLRAMDSGGTAGLSAISGYFAFAMLRRRRDGWHAAIVRDDTARLRVGRTSKGHAWGTTDEALAIAGAVVLGDHRTSTAALFGPDGTCEVRPIRKAKPAPVPMADFEEKWAIAQGRSVRSYSLGGAK
jgi:hypothetical protein